MSIRTTLTVPSLIGGISQQPAHLALPSQVRDATNCNFDLSLGISKRAGTTFDRKFTDDPCGSFRIGLFRYSASEEYIVFYGRGTSAGKLRAFRVGGNEIPVTTSGAATTYMDLNSATGDQMRLRPIADYCLLINTTVATGLTTSAMYAVERNLKDYEVVIGFSTSVGYYVRAEADSTREPAGYFQYNPGTYTYALMNLRTVTNAWSISYGYWDDTTGGFITAPCGFRVSFQRVGLTGFTAATFTTATGTITKVGAFAGYTYRPGDMIYITAGTGFTAGWFKILSRTSDDAIVIAGGPGADNVNTAANDSSTIARIGIEVEVVLDFTKTVATDMAEVAAEIQRQLRRTGATNATCVWVPGGVGGAFQITAPWRGNNAKIFPCTPATASFLGANGDLTLNGGAQVMPFDGTSSYQIFNGTGGVAADVDDTATPESRWTRVAAPSQASAQPDVTKLPLKLTRTAENALSLDSGPWKPRTSGDATTNPAPDLFTNLSVINDAALFRDRLWLAGGAYISGSQAGDSFDFFQANFANIVDSDRISRSISSSRTASIEYLTQFRNTLVLFAGAAGEFELSAIEAMTPTTASLTESSADISATVRPEKASDSIFFIATRGGQSSLHEYFYNELSVQSETFDATRHVPTLLPNTIRSLAVCPLSEALIVLPKDGNGGYQMFSYQYHKENGKYVQTAHGRMIFDGGYRICDIAGSGTEVWMLVEGTAAVTATAANPTVITYNSHGLSNGDTVVIDNSTTTPTLDGSRVISNVTANTFTVAVNVTVAGTARICTGAYILERLSTDRQQATTGWAYPIHMDRQITLTGSHAAGTTTWTLPNTPTVLSGSAQFPGIGSTLNQIVLGPAFGASSGTVVSIGGYTATTVTASGNYSAGSVVLGRFFDWSSTLNRPFIRDQNGNPDIHSPLSIETTAATYTDTCGFTISSAQSLRTTRTRAVDNGAVPTTGTLDTMLNGDVRGTNPITLTITDSTPKPANIAGVQYTIEHSPIDVVADRGN